MTETRNNEPELAPRPPVAPRERPSRSDLITLSNEISAGIGYAGNLVTHLRGSNRWDEARDVEQGIKDMRRAQGIAERLVRDA